MADNEQTPEPNPIEQLVELLVYAPIGLLYEYEDVLPKLVRRGKSQVQLARVIGQMAVKGRQNDPSAVVGDVAGMATSAVARLITDVGAQIGLAPQDEPPTGNRNTATGPAATDGAHDDTDDPSTQAATAAEAETPEEAPDVDEGSSSPNDDEPLPIAGYDDLTAREIIGLLDELTAAQRGRVRAHEVQGRNRKTVLAKLDRLDA
ncbi:MAG: hypothetical protein AAGD35_05445 [Actinomycetota bacterium]